MISAYLQSSVMLNCSIEERLLLCCARIDVNDEITKQIRLLIQQNINWNELIELANCHQVSPLIYRNLQKIGADLIPIDVLTRLRELNYVNIADSMSLASKLLDLLSCFATENIRVIPYKGAVLAATIYGDICLRQFSDIDLFIAVQDTAKAIALLNDRGYKSTIYRFGNLYQWEETLTHTETGVQVDLHYGMAPSYYPFRIDFDHCIERCQNVDLLNSTLQGFSIEDLLLVLSVQIVKDSYAQTCVLIKVCDIAEIVNRYPTIQWNQAIDRANSIGCQRFLLLGLLLSHELLGIVLPISIWKLIKKDWVMWQYGKLLSVKFFYPDTHNILLFIFKILMLIEYPLSAPHNMHLLRSMLVYPFAKWSVLRDKYQ